MNLRVDSEKAILIIKISKDVFFIKLSDIWYIEKFGNKAIIKTKNDEFEIRISLKDIIDILPRNFIQSHRSYIINRNNIFKLQYVKNNIYKVFFNKDECEYAFANKNIFGLI